MRMIPRQIGSGTPPRHRRAWTAALTGLVILGLSLAGVAGAHIASRRAAAIGGPVTFAPPVSYLHGNVPNQLALGDFNGDGSPDLITAGSWQNVCTDLTHCSVVPATVNVLLNNGHGVFTPVATPALSSTNGVYTSIVTADFDRDGIKDAAVLDIGTNTIHVLRGNGDGTFRAPTAATTIDFSTTNLRPSFLAVGDFNGDGFPDLITANNNGTTVLGSVTVLLGHGDGTFEAVNPVLGAGSNTFATGGTSEPTLVAVGDFNGDGKLDVATVNVNMYGFMGGVVPQSAMSSASYSVLFGNGSGGLSLMAGSPVGDSNHFPVGITTGDFTGDGRTDIILSNDPNHFGSDQLTVLLGQSNGTFLTSYTQAINSGQYPPADVEAGDFNGDGHLDLFVPTQYGDINVLLGNGDGTFKPPLAFTNPVGRVGNGNATVGDFSGRGLADVAMVAGGAILGPVMVWLNTTVVVPLTFAASVGTPHVSVNGASYVSSATPVTLSGSEPGGTVSTISYRVYPLHGTPPPFVTVQGATAAIHLTGADGVYSLDYYATDAQDYGGQPDAHHLTLTLDNTAPHTALGIGQPQATQDGVTYVTKDTPFTLTADDGGGAGVASLAYRFYPVGATPPAFTTANGANATFTLSGPNGAFEVDYDATDWLGNDPAAKLLVTLTDSFPGADTAGPVPSGPAPGQASAATPSPGALAQVSQQANAPQAVLPRASRGVVVRRAVSSPWAPLLALGVLLALLGLAGLGAAFYRARQPARTG